MRIIQRCGTRIGYSDHNKYGTEPCADCLKAYAAAMKAWRHRTGRTTRTITDDTTLKAHGIDVPK